MNALARLVLATRHREESVPLKARRFALAAVCKPVAYFGNIAAIFGQETYRSYRRGVRLEREHNRVQTN